LFNRYAGDANTFGAHIDNAVRTHAATARHVRTDISCTLFLSRPESYDGGELVVHDTYGEQRVKLGAGELVMYPGTSVHRVDPVTALAVEPEQVLLGQVDLLRQRFAQQAARAELAGAHRRLRNIQHRGGLLDAQLLHAAHHEDGAERFGQFLDLALQQRAQFGAHEGAGGRLAVRPETPPRLAPRGLRGER